MTNHQRLIEQIWTSIIRKYPKLKSGASWVDPDWPPDDLNEKALRLTNYFRLMTHINTLEICVSPVFVNDVDTCDVGPFTIIFRDQMSFADAEAVYRNEMFNVQIAYKARMKTAMSIEPWAIVGRLPIAIEPTATLIRVTISSAVHKVGMTMYFENGYVEILQSINVPKIAIANTTDYIVTVTPDFYTAVRKLVPYESG